MRRWLYTYDGLYKVVKYWEEKGTSGFNVFKFGLKRFEGQPPLLVCKDMSGGQEAIQIPTSNLVDDPPVPHTG
ncbi:hypothetical protein MKX01_036485 [Papaver californicum]|nr:hypothetical protein MKX01_036485 [Papaver californicum]